MSDDLDDLLADLTASTAKPASSTPQQAKPTHSQPPPARNAPKTTNDDLDDLMAELNNSTNVLSASIKPAPASVQQQPKPAPAPVAAPAKKDDLDDLMAELSAASTASAPTKQPEPSRAQPAPVNVTQSKPQTAKATDDLDALMADLSNASSAQPASQPAPQPTRVATQQPQQKVVQQPVPSAAPPKEKSVAADDLDSLLDSLSEAKPAPAQQKPTTQQAKPAPQQSKPAPAPATTPQSKPSPAPAPQQKPAPVQAKPVDDLDSLLDSLNTAGDQPKPVPQPKPSPAHAQPVKQTPAPSNAKPAPAKSGEDLDALLDSLSEAGNVQASPPRAQPVQVKPTAQPKQEIPPPAQPKQSSKADDLDALLDSLSVEGNAQAKPAPAQSKSVPQQVQAKPVSAKPVNDASLDDLLDQLQPSGQSQAKPAAKPSQPAAVAPTPGKGDELDALLSNLSAKMNDIDNTESRGTCVSCGQPITGEIIQALGKSYHPEHFLCGNCKTPLGTATFFEADGVANCERCYKTLMCPRCAHCDQPILDRCISAMGKKWHLNHFICATCLKPFDNGTFYEKDGRPYCEADFFASHATKCASCDQPIRGDCINALGAKWHPEHFVCNYCHKAFVGGAFYEHNNKPYCETHFYQVTGAVCAGCGKPVSGRVLNALDRKWHPEHFVCSFCMNPLSGGAFKEEKGKAYCTPCHSKLFG